ncbi:MAG: hypothetical protein JSW02_02050 [candidate division WOR-3 bacterium]|nr:MAG: hypothetical protein JSW02_02050 [candidate division WOR-3 bacterium]
MRKLLALSLTLAVLIAIVGCGDEVALVAPGNFTISAGVNELDVVLDWDEVTEEIDGYIIYFNDVAADTVTTAGYTHLDPQVSGVYYVTAYSGEDESDPSATATTVPEVVDDITVYEINGSGSSGFGWDRTDGSATAYSMADATNAAFIDFYFSDWAAGFAGDYSFISPDLVETDPGVTWPMSGTWNSSAFTDVLPEQFADVIVVPETGYFTSMEVTATNATYAVYTDDGYYGMVEVKSMNTGDGTLSLRVAFQMVPGLRILEH